MSGRESAFSSAVVGDHRPRPAVPPRGDFGQAEAYGSARPDRPDTTFLVNAVVDAAASIAARDERIRDFEEQQRGVEDLVDRMKSKLGELMRLKQTSDAVATSAIERADRAEAKAARLEVRLGETQGELDAALSDLQRISDVITGSLISPTRGR